MFDFAWSEIALIGVVALVVIGPKDLPEAIRGVARGITKLRRMASEFQGQADELVREANLDEVRNSINEIRNFNVRDQLTKAVDKDGSIRKTFTEDPLKPDYTPYTPPPVTPATVTEPPPGAMEGASANFGQRWPRQHRAGHQARARGPGLHSARLRAPAGCRHAASCGRRAGGADPGHARLRASGRSGPRAVHPDPELRPRTSVARSGRYHRR